MADDPQPTPTHTKLERLQDRLEAMESQASKDEQGWVGRFGRAGIVVGCLAGLLGGVGAGIALYKDLKNLILHPHVQLVFLGDNIEAHWDTQAKRLSFDCWLVATNDGGADDTLRAAAARLWTAKGETFSFPHIVIKERGDGVPRPVFHLDPNKQLDVLVTVTSVLDDRSEQAFRKLGVYKLVLDFEAPVSRLHQSMTHCFSFREQAAGELTSLGSLALWREDSCEELQKAAGQPARD
jgi:hypothetical protein